MRTSSDVESPQLSYVKTTASKAPPAKVGVALECDRGSGRLARDCRCALGSFVGKRIRSPNVNVNLNDNVNHARHADHDDRIIIARFAT
jgi:hypothetical protein